MAGGAVAAACETLAGRLARIGAHLLQADAQSVTVAGGYVEVTGSHVRVLADAAEHPSEIDVERAQRALHRASDRLSKIDGQVDVARAINAMRRAQGPKGRPISYSSRFSQSSRLVFCSTSSASPGHGSSVRKKARRPGCARAISATSRSHPSTADADVGSAGSGMAWWKNGLHLARF